MFMHWVGQETAPIARCSRDSLPPPACRSRARRHKFYLILDGIVETMELITFGKEMLQTLAEQAASYRLGQMALRQLDRALWLLEKSARWALPPPLDDRPQPELVRPLPWVFFLILLVVLRATRESISLVNLVMGKPPLRASDIVMYIQGKRRYLRTLKYQGNRIMRARTSHAPSQQQSWFSSFQSLFEFTMCFRHTAHSDAPNNDQILVVKRKRSGEASPAATNSENTMERLIEKMMVDLNADSDDDSSYTLTNATSVKTDSEPESDQDTVFSNDVSSSTPQKTAISTPEKHTANSSQEKESLNTAPERATDNKSDFNEKDQHNAKITKENSVTESSEVKPEDKANETTLKSDDLNSTPEKDEANTTLKDGSKEEVAGTTPSNRSIPRSENNKKSSSKNNAKINNNDVNNKSGLGVNNNEISAEDRALASEAPKSVTIKEDTHKFIQSEKCVARPQGKSSQKIENTRH